MALEFHFAGEAVIVSAAGRQSEPMAPWQALELLANVMRDAGMCVGHFEFGSNKRKVAPGWVRIETAFSAHEFPAFQVAPAKTEFAPPLDGSADCGHDVAG